MTMKKGDLTRCGGPDELPGVADDADPVASEPPEESAPLPRAFRAALLIELVVATLLRGRLLTRPLAVVDRMLIPDDTYYTLTIARSLAAGHGPTVDGHTLTSGFQPLLAFLMTPVFWVSHNPDQALRANIALLLLCDLVIIVLLAHIAHRLAGPAAAVVAAGIWAVSPMALVMAAGGLETTLALACELALVAAALLVLGHPSTARCAMVGAAAALAVLARIDAAILVTLIVLVLSWRIPATARSRLMATSALVAALVLAPWWCYCLLRFGTPIPGSGDAARAIQGEALQPFGREAIARVGSSALTGPFGPWTDRRVKMVTDVAWWPFALVVVASLVFAAVALRPRTAPNEAVASNCVDPGHRYLIGAAALFVPALMAFYAWYDVRYFDYRYLAPIAPAMTLAVAAALGPLVGCLGTAVTTRRGVWLGGERTFLATAALALLVWAGPSSVHATVNLMTSEVAYAGLAHPPDSSVGYRRQALAVDAMLPRGVVVVSNQSGALGYYAGRTRTVVNLDGVVNPAAAAAAEDKHKAVFARSIGARYMVDWPRFVVHFALQAKTSDLDLRMSRISGVPSTHLPDLIVEELSWPGDLPD